MGFDISVVISTKMSGPTRDYRFGDWLVDPDVNQVRRGGDTKHLESCALRTQYGAVAPRRIIAPSV